MTLFWGLTTTAMPSIATGSSMNPTLLSPQSPCSDSLMKREASEMSVSSLQNFLKPPPLPEIPTGTRTLEKRFWYSSATACVIGPTVLEPSTRIVPSIGPGGAVTVTIFSTPWVTTFVSVTT